MSKCKKIRRNKTNKRCPADLADMIEDDAGEAPMDIGVEATTPMDKTGRILWMMRNLPL